MPINWKFFTSVSSAIFLVASGVLAEDGAPNSISCINLNLFFTDARVAESRDCSAMRSVTRRVCDRSNLSITVLLELLKGVSEQEKAAGLTSSFEPSNSLHPLGTKPLREYLKGVTVANAVATVEFESGARAYLNGASCHQASVKSAIERTLLQFSTIHKVQYSIDGALVAEWDA